MEKQEPAVIIVGAGPSGLAMAACLNQLSIPYIILEREDCFASLWKKKSYDRVHLHLAKQFCELPHKSFPSTCPTYVPRKEFLEYLDDYVSHFKISPIYERSVESATYDEGTKKWNVKVRNGSSDETAEDYSGRFLVVATGETSDAFIPDVEGLSTFTGEVIHSTQYKSGENYSNKNVLVVGSGNSGMEIALDLSNFGAKTSIVVRSPIHILSRGMVYLGLVLLKHIPVYLVDSLLVMLSKLRYGSDLSKYGIIRPQEGPFFLKVKYGKYPVVDVGTYKKIKSGEIQVLPSLTSIRGNSLSMRIVPTLIQWPRNIIFSCCANEEDSFSGAIHPSRTQHTTLRCTEVVFENGTSHPFDTIVFSTGFKRSTNKWLKGDDYLLNDDGLPKPGFPNHWKGENGLYCAGLARRGLYGAAMDAHNIANHIKTLL